MCFFGRRGNNPYCHHRALSRQRAGIRERLVQVQQAGGAPFDHGLFALLEEPAGAAWPEGDPLRFQASQHDAVAWPAFHFGVAAHSPVKFAGTGVEARI